MKKKSAAHLILFCLAIAAGFAGLLFWLTASNERARTEAFARHDHSGWNSRPCLLLPEDTDMSASTVIRDCLLLDPLGKKPNIFEIDLTTGLLVVVRTDLYIPGEIPIALTRWYRPWDTRVRGFGLAADLTYNLLPVGDTIPFTYLDLALADRHFHYDRISPGTSYHDAVYRHEGPSSEYSGSEIRWSGNGWTLQRRDGWMFEFPKGNPHSLLHAKAALKRLTDPHGRVVQLTRSPMGELTKVESPSGSWIELDYDGRKAIRAKDSLGRSVRYEYDGQERLIKIVDGEGLTEYSYARSTFLSGVQKGGVPILQSEYHRDGRVARVTLADGKVYEFFYTGDGKKVIATITRSDGKLAMVRTTRDGYTVTDWRKPVTQVLR